MCPVYCFSTSDGRVVEEFYHPTETVPKIVRLDDGSLASRDFAAEMKGSKRRRPSEGGKAPWPMKSRAMGVHVNQVRDAMKADPDAKFDSQTGEAIFDSPQHREQCLKRAGFVDLDGVP